MRKRFQNQVPKSPGSVGSKVSVGVVIVALVVIILGLALTRSISDDKPSVDTRPVPQEESE